MDQLLADENLATGETLWALTDHLGSVRDLVDDAGTLRIHTAYDSFGNVQGEQFFDDQGQEVAAGDAEAVDTLFGYTGRPFDDETQLQNNHHRWYDAGVGRWLSQDPIGFAGGNANLYRYVGNGSTGAVDPSGLREPIQTDYILELDERINVRGEKLFIINPVDKHFFLWVTGRTMLYDAWVMIGRGISQGYSDARCMIFEQAQSTSNPFESGVLEIAGAATYPMQITSQISMRVGQVGVLSTATVVPGAVPILKNNESLLRIGGTVFTLKHAVETGIRQIDADPSNNPSVGDYADMAVGVYALGSEIAPQSNVSHWGGQGLKCESWVQKGSPGFANWMLSGKWQPGGGNTYAPLRNGQVYQVPSSHLVWPRDGIIDGTWKGILGQRVYIGPDISAD